MIILDGKVVSQARRTIIKTQAHAYLEKYGRAPHLAVVLVGEDPASQVYVRNKEIACASVGIKSTKLVLPTNITQAELNLKVANLLADDLVDGVLVQLPLPKGLTDQTILEQMDPLKDVDGFSTMTTGRLWSGRKLVAPCTPQGVIHILKHYQIPIAGKTAVVVGRSQIVGRPMVQLLLEEDATVIVCHSKTPDLRQMTLQGDIVVVAAGRPEFLGKEDFKKGAVVIDVGIHGTGVAEVQPIVSGGAGLVVKSEKPKNKLVGDVRFAELAGHIAAATPVPGGVGPMTITCLLENTVQLAKLRQESK